MKTSSEINKYLQLLKSKKIDLELDIREFSSFNVLGDDNVEDNRPEFDLLESMYKLTELNKEEIRIKTALNTFNNITRLDCGLTIAQALVRLPQLNEEKRAIAPLIRRRLPVRKSLSSNGSIIEYNYANYDIEKAKEYYDELDKKITDIQLQLNVTNNKSVIDVDWD